MSGPADSNGPLTPLPDSDSQADPFESTDADIDSATLQAPVLSRTPESAEDVHDLQDEYDVEDLLAPGSMLGPNYRVVGPIGAGGMGAVYEVEHRRMKKRYAAKVLRREVSSSPEYVRRLEREAVAASHIEHPGIVQVVNLDETPDGRVYLIMELLQGQDLGEFLENGAADVDVAITVVLEVASALQAAHEAGIIHRDLKPENIFLARKRDGTVVKVVDFGISKVDAGHGSVKLTKTGYILGTPLYMSPEHAEGDVTLDERADIYSLGVILYEALAGRPPFQGTKPIEVMLAHVSKPHPTLRSINKSLPEELEAFLDKALDKDRQARFQTMAEFGAELTAVGKAIGVEEARLPQVKPGRRRTLSSLTPRPVSVSSSAATARRFPAWGTAALAAVLLATVAAGSYLMGSRTDSPPTPPARSAVQPTPAAVPAQVRISFESTPAGAAVRAGDLAIGVTPVSRSSDPAAAPVEYTFELAGHEPVKRRVVPDRDRVVRVSLHAVVPEPPAAAQPVPAPPPAKKARKRRPAAKGDAPAGFRDRR